MPTASNLVTFAVSGEGVPIGVGNGDPSCHEPDKCPAGAWRRSLFNGKCQIIVQSSGRPGEVEVVATSAGLASSTHTIDEGGRVNIRPAEEK